MTIGPKMTSDVTFNATFTVNRRGVRVDLPNHQLRFDSKMLLKIGSKILPILGKLLCAK